MGPQKKNPTEGGIRWPRRSKHLLLISHTVTSDTFCLSGSWEDNFVKKKYVKLWTLFVAVLILGGHDLNNYMFAYLLNCGSWEDFNSFLITVHVYVKIKTPYCSPILAPRGFDLNEVRFILYIRRFHVTFGSSCSVILVMNFFYIPHHKGP